MSRTFVRRWRISKGIVFVWPARIYLDLILLRFLNERTRNVTYEMSHFFPSSLIPDEDKASCFHLRKQLDVKVRVCACQQWWKTAGLFCVLWAPLPLTSGWTSTYIDRTLSIRPDSLSCDKKQNFLITENGNTWRIQTKESHWHVMSGECEGCLSVSVGADTRQTHSRVTAGLRLFGSRPAALRIFIMGMFVFILLLFKSMFISAVWYYK